MKREAFSLISLLSLLLVGELAIAQTSPVRSNIPFNFTVGDKTLPAGTYDIGAMNSSGGNMLLLEAQGGNSSMMVG